MLSVIGAIILIILVYMFIGFEFAGEIWWLIKMIAGFLLINVILPIAAILIVVGLVIWIFIRIFG